MTAAIDPRPRAIKGPVHTAPQETSLKTDKRSAKTSIATAEDAPQRNLGFATPDNGIGTNANFDFYTVPAGKIFVCTSCRVSENTSTATNIQFVALKAQGGVGKQANAYLYGGETKEIITTPVKFLAGNIVRISTGGAVTNTIAHLQGYEVSSVVTDPPDPVDIDEGEVE